MADVEQRIAEVMQVRRASQKQDLKALALYLLGTSVFVGFTAFVILICNNCTRATSLKEFFNGSVSFWGALVSAISVLILWGIVFLVFRYHIRQVLGDPTLALVRTMSRLAGNPEGAANGIVPIMQGAMATLQQGIDAFQSLATTEWLAKRHVIAFSANPEEALHKLVDGLVADNNDVNSLRIVATMRGVYGKKTYELGIYIVNYLERRIAAGKTTLKDIRVLAPRNLNTPLAEPNLRLYPICARHFALQVILSALPIYGKVGEAERKQRLPLVISLSYNGQDIFPAWHLWCNRRLVILPSLGYEDHDKLSEALPIAIMAKDDDPLDLDSTFTRLQRHFDLMFDSGFGNGREQWELGADMQIRARGVKARTTQENLDTDDNEIAKACPRWSAIITGNENVLTGNEAEELKDCMGRMALIIQ